MFVFPQRLDQLSRFHRWVDLALLFKNGVGRKIAVLEVADNVFSNVQIPAILFLNFADDALQVTSPKAPFCVQNFFLEAPSLQPRRERYTATTVWCSMAKATVAVVSRREVSPRLARQCGSQKKTTSPSKRIKYSSPPQQSSHTWLQKLVEASDARATGRRSLISWRRSTLSLCSRSTTTRLRCCCSFRSYGYAVRGVDLQGSDGRGVSQLPICTDTLFLLNECSLSQNECLWPLQTNFYRTFGRFVSALIIIIFPTPFSPHSHCLPVHKWHFFFLLAHSFWLSLTMRESLETSALLTEHRPPFLSLSLIKTVSSCVVQIVCVITNQGSGNPNCFELSKGCV